MDLQGSLRHECQVTCSRIDWGRNVINIEIVVNDSEINPMANVVKLS